jgi:hypothetical protein
MSGSDDVVVSLLHEIRERLDKLEDRLAGMHMDINTIGTDANENKLHARLFEMHAQKILKHITAHDAQLVELRRVLKPTAI